MRLTLTNAYSKIKIMRILFVVLCVLRPILCNPTNGSSEKMFWDSLKEEMDGYTGRPMPPELLDMVQKNNNTNDESEDCMQEFRECLAVHKAYPVCGKSNATSQLRLFVSMCEFEYKGCMDEADKWDIVSDSQCKHLTIENLSEYTKIDYQHIFEVKQNSETTESNVKPEDLLNNTNVVTTEESKIVKGEQKSEATNNTNVLTTETPTIVNEEQISEGKNKTEIVKTEEPKIVNEEQKLEAKNYTNVVTSEEPKVMNEEQSEAKNQPAEGPKIERNKSEIKSDEPKPNDSKVVREINPEHNVRQDVLNANLEPKMGQNVPNTHLDLKMEPKNPKTDLKSEVGQDKLKELEQMAGQKVLKAASESKKSQIIPVELKENNEREKTNKIDLKSEPSPESRLQMPVARAHYSKRSNMKEARNEQKVNELLNKMKDAEIYANVDEVPENIVAALKSSIQTEMKKHNFENTDGTQISSLIDDNQESIDENTNNGIRQTLESIAKTMYSKLDTRRMNLLRKLLFS